MREAIEAGIEKIKTYHTHMAKVPAYTFAMGKSIFQV